MIKRYTERIYIATVRQLDRFLQTDSSFLIHGGSWGIFARVISSGLLFILSFLYARYLPQDLYGTYRYVFSVLGMFGFLTFTDFLTSFSRAAAHGKEHLYRLEGRIYFLLSLPLALLGIGIGIYFFVKGNTLLGTAFLIAGLFTPLRDGITIFNGWLVLKRKFKEKATILIIENILSLLLIALIIAILVLYNISMPLALALLLGAYSIGHGIPRLFYFFRISKQIPTGPSEPMRPMVKFGIHLSLSNVLPIIATYLDSILVFSFLGAQSLAIYSFAILIPEQIKGLLKSIATIAQPKIFSKNDDTFVLLPKKLFRSTFIVGIGIVAYFFISPYIFEIFFPRYIDSVLFSQVFMLSMIAVPVAVLGSAIIAKQNIVHLYIFRTLGPIIQIALIVTLIPMFGIWGAVWARVISLILKSSIMLFIFRSQT